MSLADLCQACLTEPVFRSVESGDERRPFLVCRECAERLEHLALRPLEWFRLATLHGPVAYLLHDDFYSDDGVADQNRIPVAQAALFPAPTLEAVQADLPRLLDYAITRWRLEAPVAEALKAHAPERLLPAMSQLIQARPVAWVESRCLEIAARLGGTAGDWVSARWACGAPSGTLFALLEAAAACLPASEALPRAFQAVETEDGKDISVTALALVHFQSPLVLEWIERTVLSPVSDRWGYLAARSGLTWHAASRWLEQGRPMSLVALDALVNVYRPSSSALRPASAVLPDRPETPVVVKALREACLRDPVPRVEKAVAVIARHLGD